MDTPSVGRIGDYIKEQRENAKLSLRRLAAEAGVSNPYLSQVERGLRKPSAEILQQLAKALRISAEQLYIQAGLLEDKGASLAVHSAVFNDLRINERQKRVLLDIYSSFLHENGFDDDKATKKPRTAKKATTAPSTKAKKATKKTTKRSASKTTSTKKSPTKQTARKTSKTSKANVRSTTRKSTK